VPVDIVVAIAEDIDVAEAGEVPEKAAVEQHFEWMEDIVVVLDSEHVVSWTDWRWTS